ncbi:MAG: glycosyltransferase family 4 protein, partial [Acidobacteriota bacterium]
SGDEARVREKLAELFPRALIETIPRNEIETGGFASRLSSLRARRPNVFAVATERLAWQRGQNLFLLFGGLAGARESVILDAHGGLRRESRSSLLVQAPTRFAREGIASAVTMARAGRELERLEKEVKDRSALSAERKPHSPASAARPLEIVYLRATPGPGTQVGGAASHIKGVIEGFVEQGAAVSLISNDVLAGLNESKIKLNTIGPEAVGSTRTVFDIHNNGVLTRGAVPLIERSPPDFIYQRYARFSWAGVVASLRTERPLFLEYNGSEVWVGRHWDRVSRLDLLARYERLNLAAAARVFVVSDVERKNLESAGLPAEKIIVNPNGVDTQVFRPNVGGNRVRAELGVGDAQTLVGFVGSFGPWHGVLILAEAIKLLFADSSLRFLLVGTGSLQGEMQRVLSAEDEAGRVIFAGAVAHEEVPALLDACDILVSPHVPLAGGADFFGSPTKLFEYMAMGKGIVASRLGQIGEVLSDEETALLVEPGDARELSTAINRLANSPALRERLGTAARQAAIERHTWKRNALNVVETYRSWLAEGERHD